MERFQRKCVHRMLLVGRYEYDSRFRTESGKLFCRPDSGQLLHINVQKGDIINGMSVFCFVKQLLAALKKTASADDSQILRCVCQQCVNGFQLFLFIITDGNFYHSAFPVRRDSVSCKSIRE